MLVHKCTGVCIPYVNVHANVHTVPNGLLCLQVDDLKEKLAAQEVELQQKNDDADALIKRVGIEQEKVSVCVCVCVCMRMCMYA